MKYYNNNLVYAYKIWLMVATILVAVCAMVTLYVVVTNYKSYEKAMGRTYVYGSNGASIEVNLKPKK